MSGLYEAERYVSARIDLIGIVGCIGSTKGEGSEELEIPGVSARKHHANLPCFKCWKVCIQCSCIGMI